MSNSMSQSSNPQNYSLREGADSGAVERSPQRGIEISSGVRQQVVNDSVSKHGQAILQRDAMNNRIAAQTALTKDFGGGPILEGNLEQAKKGQESSAWDAQAKSQGERQAIPETGHAKSEPKHTQATHKTGQAKPSHTEPSHTEFKHTEPKHVESRHTGPRHTESSHTESKHTEPKHIEPRHTESSHTESKHTEPKHIEPRHTGSSHTESKHTEPKHAESKRAETKHTESKQAETKQAETKHTESKHAEPTHETGHAKAEQQSNRRQAAKTNEDIKTNNRKVESRDEQQNNQNQPVKSSKEQTKVEKSKSDAEPVASSAERNLEQKRKNDETVTVTTKPTDETAKTGPTDMQNQKINMTKSDNTPSQSSVDSIKTFVSADSKSNGEKDVKGASVVNESMHATKLEGKISKDDSDRSVDQMADHKGGQNSKADTDHELRNSDERNIQLAANSNNHQHDGEDDNDNLRDHSYYNHSADQQGMSVVHHAEQPISQNFIANHHTDLARHASSPGEGKVNHSVQHMISHVVHTGKEHVSRGREKGEDFKVNDSSKHPSNTDPAHTSTNQTGTTHHSGTTNGVSQNGQNDPSGHNGQHNHGTVHVKHGHGTHSTSNSQNGHSNTSHGPNSLSHDPSAKGNVPNQNTDPNGHVNGANGSQNPPPKSSEPNQNNGSVGGGLTGGTTNVPYESKHHYDERPVKFLSHLLSELGSSVKPLNHLWLPVSQSTSPEIEFPISNAHNINNVLGDPSNNSIGNMPPGNQSSPINGELVSNQNNANLLPVDSTVYGQLPDVGAHVNRLPYGENQIASIFSPDNNVVSLPSGQNSVRFPLTQVTSAGSSVPDFNGQNGVVNHLGSAITNGAQDVSSNAPGNLIAQGHTTNGSFTAQALQDNGDPIISSYYNSTPYLSPNPIAYQNPGTPGSNSNSDPVPIDHSTGHGRYQNDLPNHDQLISAAEHKHSGFGHHKEKQAAERNDQHSQPRFDLNNFGQMGGIDKEHLHSDQKIQHRLDQIFDRWQDQNIKGGNTTSGLGNANGKLTAKTENLIGQLITLINDLNKNKKQSPNIYIVKKGDTFESVATKILRDGKLGFLLYVINQKNLIQRSSVEWQKINLTEGTVLYLPSNEEIINFRSVVPNGINRSESADAQWHFDQQYVKGMEERRNNIERLLGPLNPLKQSKYNPETGRQLITVRLGDTLRSIALKHPALNDVALWKLLAISNDLSTQMDSKGVPTVILTRGTLLQIPGEEEVAAYRASQAAIVRAYSPRKAISEEVLKTN